MSPPPSPQQRTRSSSTRYAFALWMAATLALPTSARAANADPAATPAAPTTTATQQSAPRRTIFVMKLAAGGIDKADAASLDEVIAEAVEADERLQVTTGEDVSRLLTLETEKQLMGCDSSSCFTEIADALDADYLLNGRVGRLGGRVSLSLSLFDRRGSKAVTRVTQDAASIEDLGRVAPRLVSRALVTVPGPPPAWTMPTLIGGGIVAGVGVLALASPIIPALAIHEASARYASASRDKTRQDQAIQDAAGWQTFYEPFVQGPIPISGFGLALFSGAVLVVGGTVAVFAASVARAAAEPDEASQPSGR